MKNTKVNERRKSSGTLQLFSGSFLILSSIIMNIWIHQGVKSENVIYFEISENVPIGSTVGFIDIESPPYLIVPVPGSPVKTDLLVDPITGEIKTKILLDRETTPTYTFVILPPNNRVVIKVLDENDNIPTFPTKQVEVEFPENSPRNSKRALPPAKDLDAAQYSTQHYEIISGNIGDVFKLSQHRGRNGVLYLDLQNSGYLDREVCYSYELIIEALDGGLPPLRSSLHVNVLVQDVNDNTPIFNQTRYIASIPENITIGAPVIKVHATDADAGMNGKIKYSINRRQSDKQATFQINSETGVVYVNKALDFEHKEHHELVIIAKDMGAQPLETSVFLSIYVRDVNDNQPLITIIFLSDDATPKISESAQPGEFIARISVSDPDLRTEYSNITLSLFGGDGRFGLTTRDNIIYLVVVEQTLDREDKPIYDLSVEATDAGIPPLCASKKFRLLVTDINDNAPVFEQSHYEAYILQTSEPGTSILTVKATDADDGVNAILKYSLKNSTSFTINTESGLISSVTHIDCETNPTINLVVIVTDNGRPSLSGSATVNIAIRDFNNNEPIFEKSFYNVSVLEDLSTGHCFLKVRATDLDCGINSTVTYALDIGHEIAHERFFVRSDTGDICIQSSLDRETLPFLEFAVIATDLGGLSAAAIVRVEIIDVNDNRPIFHPQSYNVTIRPDILPNSTILKVFAYDLDYGLYGRVNYRVVSGNGVGEFRIDRITGDLQVIQPNRLSQSKIYYLNVTATDSDGLRSITNAYVTVSVKANKDSPLCEAVKYTIKIKENTLENSIIGTVKHTKRSVSDEQIRYCLTSGNTEFMIDPTSGILKSKITFHSELQDMYVLNVGIKNDKEICYCQVEVAVEDINDNPPSFFNIRIDISIPESFSIYTPFYVAHATDADKVPAQSIHYVLNQNVNDPFKIDAHLGELFLLRKMDYEYQRRYTLLISASDNDGLSANMSLNINVQDINDNFPVFDLNEYHISIPESFPIYSQIIQVKASDADTGNNARISYRLLNSTIFLINPNTGWIFSTQILDRDTTDHYIINVISTDHGSPALTASCFVYITILDENDNSPHFKKEFYTFEIAENLPSGTFVGSVDAFDYDTGRNALLKYAIVQLNSSFAIDSSTGVITTQHELDREKMSNYELILEVKDSGKLPRYGRASLRITILDVNDNTPIIIDPQSDILTVREEQVPETEVAKVRAMDLDLEENATITFTILKDVDSSSSDVFGIDPSSGIIKTKVVLDHEEQDIYCISVKATDAGQPPRYSIRTWRIKVLALADNGPTLTSSSLLFHVREDAAIGHVIGSVISVNSAVRFSYTLNFLTPSLIHPIFDINRSSGELVVADLLDRENINEYNLEIHALDMASVENSQIVTVLVKIIIEDFNDNAPEWRSDPIILETFENTDIGNIIFNFTATDLDSGLNGDVRYEIIHEIPSTGSFTIDFVTGALKVKKPLDREENDQYILTIKASDCAIPSDRLSSTVTVKIILLDENDNDPIFIAPDATKIIVQPNQLPGLNIIRVIAVDRDYGNNSRIFYDIASNNESSQFMIGYETGIITSNKLITAGTVLQIIAHDHGTPSRKTILNLTLVIATGQLMNSSRGAIPHLSVSVYHDFMIGGLITNIAASSNDKEENVTYRIPSGLADDKFSVSPTGMVILRKTLNNQKLFKYYIPIIIESKDNFELLILEISIRKKNSPKFLTGSCYTLAVPENQKSSVIHTFSASGVEDENGLIHYSIIGGNVGDKFKIDSKSGDLSASWLDRESTPQFILSISAQTKTSPASEDYCNITILVLDLNDNPPIFSQDKHTNHYRSGPRESDNFNVYSQTHNRFTSSSVYPNYNGEKYTVSIPEDIPTDSAIITLKANDSDQGINGKITYAIAEETTWLFRIDNLTGVITTAGSLDREQQSIYNFLVTATDESNYDVSSTSIGIEIILTDVNDNSPTFKEIPFTTTIPVTMQPGQVILQVKANDVDDGINGEISYFFLHEYKKPKFRIHPTSGLITTISVLTNDYKKNYYLEIMAKDKGIPPKNATGFIHICVDNMDENRSVLKFENDTYEVEIPENSPINKEIIQVNAMRSDGRRQHISYSIESGDTLQTFSIDPDTGIIRIKDLNSLDAEFNIILTNSVKGRELISRSFELSEESNNIEIKDHLQNNKSSKRTLILVAKTIESEPLIAHTKLIVHIVDINDNSPIFTQPQYSATVFEGNAKGAFIIKLLAIDIDEGVNSKLLYHIVDGNPDNAFTINPPHSGIVRTNIVLDREIKEEYRLTVIATDQGNPQLTGSTTLCIRVIDVNDNQPTFPGYKIISTAEDTPVGTVLSTITANDVDTFPPLTYHINDINQSTPFAIDRYSGKITLKQTLNAEKCKEYNFQVIASDSIHEAITDFTIQVIDVNDNAPKFMQVVYIVTLSESNQNVMEVVTVSAVDDDLLEENNQVHYFFNRPVKGFSIGSNTGIVLVNLTALARPMPKELDLIIVAMDSGKPPLSSSCLLIVKLDQLEDSFAKKEYEVHVNENSAKGTCLFNLADLEISNGYIISQEDDDCFEISNGNLITVENLDREHKDRYIIHLGGVHTKSRQKIAHNSITVKVIVDDVNDNYPFFVQDSPEIYVKENVSSGTVLATIKALDKDHSGTSASTIVYSITSGNDAKLFQINTTSGEILTSSTLDCDLGPEMYTLVILACDSDSTVQLCAITRIIIYLEDVNDNSPRFPVSEYIGFVSENKPAGTEIFIAHASDRDRGIFGALNYSLTSTKSEYSDITDSWKLFSVDSKTGTVTTSAVFNYEERTSYVFLLKATDAGGRWTAIQARIEIQSRDEFYPQFTEQVYRFDLDHRALPGTLIGQVEATDHDKGFDGQVVYQLFTQHHYFKLNRTTGVLAVKKMINLNDVEKISKLVVIASSGKQGSLSNSTIIEIRMIKNHSNEFFILNNLDTHTSDRNNITVTTPKKLADWALGLLITLVLLVIMFGTIFLYLYFKTCIHEKSDSKSGLNDDDTVTSHNLINSIPTRNVGGMVVSNNEHNLCNSNDRSDPCHFAPPKYDEIPSYCPSAQSMNQATSELSRSDRSGSSGRGSAEDDGEDEEIRMINEGLVCRDSFSNLSVHNTQEYLARLGIVDAPLSNPRRLTENLSMNSIHLFGEETVTEAEIATLIYGKMDDAQKSSLEVEISEDPSMNGSLSSIVHSEEELTGSYNWDYLLDWGPQYQPLAHVFSEIARLKDDTNNHGHNYNDNERHKSLHKAPPPPLLTSIAPRSLFMPLLGRGILPRSPISHDVSAFPMDALSPSFSPSLSPLATRSPSVSPLVSPASQRTQNTN